MSKIELVIVLSTLYYSQSSGDSQMVQKNGPAINVTQAARMLNVSISTIRREISRKHLHTVRVGRLHRITMKDLESYLQRRS